MFIRRAAIALLAALAPLPASAQLSVARPVAVAPPAHPDGGRYFIGNSGLCIAEEFDSDKRMAVPSHVACNGAQVVTLVRQPRDTYMVMIANKCVRMFLRGREIDAGLADCPQGAEGLHIDYDAERGGYSIWGLDPLTFSRACLSPMSRGPGRMRFSPCTESNVDRFQLRPATAPAYVAPAGSTPTTVPGVALPSGTPVATPTGKRSIGPLPLIILPPTPPAAAPPAEERVAPLPTRPDNGIYRLQTASGQCLEPLWDATDLTAAVTDCARTTPVQVMAEESSDRYSFEYPGLGRCLIATGFLRATNCNGSITQTFRFAPIGNGSFRIETYDRKCWRLVASGGGMIAMPQYCTGAADQQFWLVPAN